MDLADHQQPTIVTPSDTPDRAVALLLEIRPGLQQLSLAVARIESKLGSLVEALAEEEEAEPEQTTLDGDVVGAERNQDQPL